MTGGQVNQYRWAEDHNSSGSSCTQEECNMRAKMSASLLSTRGNEGVNPRDEGLLRMLDEKVRSLS
jgi:hypothetical protein